MQSPEKNTIITRVIGGLGNQMFQYAYARQLAIRKGATLKMDILEFKDYEFHNYSLDHFAVQKNYATEAEVAFFRKYKRRRGLMGKLLNPFFHNPRRFVEEPSYTYESTMAAVEPPAYVDGYWQSEKYFLDIKDIIRKDFELTTPLSSYSKGIAEHINGTSESISLHIRRGDFANHATVSKHHGVCPPEYYREAIAMMNEKIPSGSYFVFSDDIEWAKEHIMTGRPTEFIGQGPDKNYEDLELMRLCKHHILSNSTFGWWGAWLSEGRPGAVTIAPTKWFNKAFDTRDLIPERWIKLPY